MTSQLNVFFQQSVALLEPQKQSSIFSKSIINRIMKSNVIILLLIMFSVNLHAQETSSGTDISNTTTILLSELDRKIVDLKKMEDKISMNTWLDEQEKENAIIRLDNAKKDLRVFIHTSLEERCIKENRLLELSQKVNLMDEKLANKYLQLSNEIQKRD